MIRSPIARGGERQGFGLEAQGGVEFGFHDDVVGAGVVFCESQIAQGEAVAVIGLDHAG